MTSKKNVPLFLVALTKNMPSWMILVISLAFAVGLILLMDLGVEGVVTAFIVIVLVGLWTYGSEIVVVCKRMFLKRKNT